MRIRFFNPTVLNRLAIFAIMALLIQGCALSPSKEQELPYAYLERFELKGKLGYQSSQENGSALIHWQQNQNNYKINLSGPFGAGSMLITGDQSDITLQHKNRTAQITPEQINAELGVDIPIQQLTYWVQGLPAPNSKITQARWRDETQTQLNELQQLGWHVVYLQYRKMNGQSMPAKIQLKKGSNKLKLIIKEWRLNQQPD